MRSVAGADKLVQFSICARRESLLVQSGIHAEVMTHVQAPTAPPTARMFSPSSALISDDLKPIWAEHNDRWWAEPVCALHGTLNPLALKWSER